MSSLPLIWRASSASNATVRERTMRQPRARARSWPAPPVETCRHCHTPGQDPNFDYPKKVRNVHSATASAGRAAWELELRATPQRFDFGTVDEGTPATTTITVQNIGEGPITITDVKTN